MASMSQAPTLILTAPYAVAPRIAMVVRTTAAQGERRCSRRRKAGEKNHDSEQRNRNPFHAKPPVERRSTFFCAGQVAQRFQSCDRQPEPVMNLNRFNMNATAACVTFATFA
jgi:hypothetical protein